MLLLTALTLWAAGLALERKEPVKSKVPEPSPWRRLRDAVAAKLNQASGPSGPPPHGGPYA
jgi:hypothetical protein